MDNRRGLIIAIIAVIILAGGAGYYFWNKQGELTAPAPGGEAASEGESFLDTFFEKLKPADKREQGDLKEYKDSKGILSITYPQSWVVRSDQGRRLTGANLTPQELLNQYPPEEQGFVKGLVVAADESKDSPKAYFEGLVTGITTGQTEAKELSVNGYSAYMVKGIIQGVHYTIYIVSSGNYIVYFNYRSLEEESAHQRDIKKAINYESYAADFEAAIQSIRFLK